MAFALSEEDMEKGIYTESPEIDIKIVDSDKIEGIKCVEVHPEQMKEVVMIAEKMIEMSVDLGGVGLAAPQVGINKRFFVWEKSPEEYQVIINPSYYPNGTKTGVIESCLSYSGTSFLVKRYKNISVIYYAYDAVGEKFVKKTQNISGFRAFIFQHETDHLDGKTISTIGTMI